MDGERYNAESFCIDENEAFRWFQGYEGVTPVFCVAALKRMADEAPESVREKINKDPLGERLLSRLYFSGFPDNVMSELSSGEATVEEPVIDEAVVEQFEDVAEPVKPPVVFHITILPPVIPIDRPKPERVVGVRSKPVRAVPLSAIRSIFPHQADLSDQNDGWEKDALCAETDPEAFFPEKGGSTKAAKKVCTQCDVRPQCLERALEDDERFGIWGGLSERERRKLKRRVV